MTDDMIPIAVRAYTERLESDDSGGGGEPPWVETWPDLVLTLDTETTTDPTQQLLFGYWELSRWTPGGRLERGDRGLIHADALAERDPRGYRALKRFAEDRGVLLESRRSFVKRMLFRVAYEAQQLVCGFNLPFDLTRLAVHAGPARSEVFRGGYSLQLSERWSEEDEAWVEDKYKPRLCFKTLDSKRAFMGLKKGRDDEEYEPGRFLDLRSLAFALTNRSHSLASACRAFGVEETKGEVDHSGEITRDYIRYCVRDVRATAGLLEKLRAEFDRHPIDLKPDRTLSPASISKAYLRGLGLTPPRKKFDVEEELLGKAMVGYYGGRAECRIRRAEVPVVYLDVLSMYPTVNSLMGLWDVLIAESLHVEHVTGEVQALLEDATPGDVFEQAFWGELGVFACIRPEDDIVPVRGEYEPETRNLNIGVNRISSDQELWYALPDLVASTLLTGDAPEVVEALRLVPEGIQEGLEPIELGGQLEIDPRNGDFFQAVIERRKSLDRIELPEPVQTRLDTFLKVLANSGAYGIYAEMNPVRLPKSGSEPVRVHGLGEPFTVESGKPEKPGTFCFPPLAALTTSAARLMLALLEREVTARNGAYAFCDTDSMAIVATEDGGLVPCPGGSHTLPDGRDGVRALSWDDVDEIVERFEALKPYDPDLVQAPVLEIEDVNFGPDGQHRQLWAFAVSAKRYVLFVRRGDELEIVDAKEHGLGHLLNPVDPDDESTDWIKDIWRCAVLEARGEEVEFPHWMDRPAVSRLTVSSYHLYEPFRGMNEGKPYPEQIKPMNFMLAVSTVDNGVPTEGGEDPTQFRLVAPYIQDRDRWGSMDWINRYTGRTHPVTTRNTAYAYEARVKPYANVYREYVRHPEWKSAGPDGEPCGRQTEGLLQRRHIRSMGLQVIGKEAKRLEEVQQGLVAHRDEILEEYSEADANLWTSAVGVMRDVPREMLARKAGVSVRNLYRILSGDVQNPTPDTRRRLLVALKQMSS